MANCRYQYVRRSELDDKLLPNTFLIVRIDGKGFTKFSDYYGFEKPNDLRALELMNRSATYVLESELGKGIFLGFGQSDEYSFAFGRDFNTFNRRSSKVLTTVLSTFTAAYVHLWSTYFPKNPLDLNNLPSFDGRIIQYSTLQELRDYFKWRQVDVHINNLYNTTFWSLVKFGEKSTVESHEILRGTLSNQKNEILFDRFKINYNELPEIFRKGSILIRSSSSSSSKDKGKVKSSCNDSKKNDKDEERILIKDGQSLNDEDGNPKGEDRVEKDKRSNEFDNNRRKFKSSSSIIRCLNEDLIQDSWWNKNFDSLT